jgi:cytochrome c biogenesis protein CcdA/thiol-disulfide isomerase/thioredoxin
MLLFLLAFLGGVLTIASPCILPVLPFVFTQARRPFSRAGLPMLLGMAAAFALIASLAAVAGGWAVAANQYARFFALALLAFCGVTLLAPVLAARAFGPLAAWGERLAGALPEANHAGGSARAAAQSPAREAGGAALLGVATGMLWAPCAGPVLGLILSGAALQGPGANTFALLLAYALGAALSLALALLAGGRVLEAMRQSLGAGEWLRRGLGALALIAAAAIALGLDTGVLTRFSAPGTFRLEQSLLERLNPSALMPQARAAAPGAPESKSIDNAMNKSEDKPGVAPLAQAWLARASMLPDLGPSPGVGAAQEWLNLPATGVPDLKGKVVLVNFWTYSCINCLRSIPYVREWAQKYADQGLVVVGVHAPEFAFERDVSKVKRAIGELGINYPVAIDNRFAVWRDWSNQAWPARYLVDANGRVRASHFGEGDYEKTEADIRQLLLDAAKARGTSVAQATPGNYAQPQAAGTQHAADPANLRSPETYLGYKQADSFQGNVARDAARDYSAGKLGLNEWTLSGNWTVGGEYATANAPGAAITHRFHARDLHLVMGPVQEGKPLRFRVTIDGKAPGLDHGSDVNEAGEGVLSGHKLYQLVRQGGAVKDRTFQIQFLEGGAQAYAFTFG